jgi:stearoyl-CoA desaturase (delta-9 desaturase)
MLSQTGNALAGSVKPDLTKIAWVGTMVLLGTIGSLLTISAGAVLLFIGTTIITLCLGHSLGMHRRFIHRSYQCPRWMEVVFVHFGTRVGLAGPFGMLYTHDLRDWAQRQHQCHDYFSHANLWHQDLLWQIFCRIELESPPQFTPESSIRNDTIYRWMEKTWMLQQLPWAVLFYLIGGWGWVCWGIGSRVSISVFGHWLIGYFAHNEGHRDWHAEGAAVQGHNVAWTSLLTMGENWHNNHHAFPQSAKLGLEPGQWDPGWWVLKCLQRCGLVWCLNTPSTKNNRHDLVRL